MGLPYDPDEFREMIEEEDEKLRSGVTVLDGTPIGIYHVLFKEKKYTITGSYFIRSIEPFNQELCDLLFQALKTIEVGQSDTFIPAPLGGISVGDMVGEAMWIANGGKRPNTWDSVLRDDPDFDDEDESD